MLLKVFYHCFEDSDSESESSLLREGEKSGRKLPKRQKFPAPKKDPKPFGLKLLGSTTTEEGDYAQIQLDVVAVHGLGGHRIDTWMDPDSNYFWLMDLPEKLGSVSARVFTFGYDATAAFGKSVAGVSDIANNLLQALRINRRNLEENNRPVIFICHSLGGIIVKQALIMAGMDSEFQQLHDSVYGVAFMGTPHLGANAADVASGFSSVVQIALLGCKTHPQLVKTLKTNSQFLLDISRNFRHQKLKKIISFYEMEVIQPMNCLIVERKSAILNFPGESQVGCNANHRSICKFSSPSDEGLQDVCGHLQIMAEAAVKQSSNISAEGKDFLEKNNKAHHFDPEKQLSEVLRKKSVNTATWIQEHPVFTNWKNSPSHETLWLTGAPGSGKTVMSASIIKGLHDDLEEAGSQKPLILHFFFDGKATDGKDYLNAMRGLLHQILAFKPFHSTNVANRISDGFPTFTLDKCTKAIHPLIKNIPKIFLILDAVDECEVLDLKLNESERDKEKGIFLRRLFELKEYTPCFKFLVTSRIHPGLELAPVFEEYSPPNISLENFQDNVKGDIERYICYELQGFRSIRNKGDNGRERRIKERIKTTILDQAGGMFLYASLAWATFKNWDDEWNEIGVEARFDKLKELGAERVGVETNTLYNLYLKILMMLPGNTERLRTNSKKLFKWLVTAHTPLTLEELRVAYALESKHDSKSSIEKHMALGDFRDVLKTNCGALVRITEASQTVHLAHQSVREFFLEANDHPFSFSRTDAEFDNSMACLTYLSFKDLSNSSSGAKSETGFYEDDFRLVREYPFLKYAVLHWSHHAMQVQDNPSLWKKFVSWTSSNNLDLCIRIFWHFKGRDDPPQNATPMHILCYLGLEKLVEKAFSTRRRSRTGEETPLEWATVSDCDTVGRTPLHWAAVNGHDKVVKLLLEENANKNQKDSRKFTPMDLAIDFGNIGVVTLLMRGERYEEHSGKWMEMAAISGHRELVDLLIKNGVEVNASSSNSGYGSALHAAAYEGHMEVVRLLLSNGAYLDYYSPKYGTPLQAAVFEGHFDIVEFLISCGADVNGKGGIHGTALQSAAHKGFGNIVEILIDKGADVNAKGEYFGSALYAANNAGHTNVQAILKRSNARSIKPTRHQQKAAEHALDLVEREVKKGRQSGVERKMERIRTDMMEAILSRNEKKLGWCLDIGVQAFRLAVKLGREGFLEFLVNIGMTVLQEAVAKNYVEGLELISRYWAKALLTAIKEGKSSLVQRTLLVCVKDFKTLVDGEKYIDARNLVHAAIVLYIEMCEAGNQQLIEIVAKIWIGAFEDLMKKAFKKDVVEIVDIYADRWAQAVQSQNEKVAKSIGKAMMEFLLAGVSDRKKEAVKCFTPLFVMHMQRALGSGQSDSARWLLDKGRPTSKTDIQEKDENLAMNMGKLGVEIFLAIAQQRPGQNHDSMRSITLSRSTGFLREIKRAGFLGKLEDTIKQLAREKFDDCGDKRQIWELERQLLGALDAVSEAEKSDRRILMAINNIRDSIKKYAADTERIHT